MTLPNKSEKNIAVRKKILNLLDAAGMKNLLIAAWHLPRRVRENVDLLAEARLLRNNFGFLSKGGHLADPDRKVLFVNADDSIAEIKLEAILAKALQLHGYTPVIVASKRHRNLKYFEFFGCDQFIFFEDLLQAIPEMDVSEELKRPRNELNSLLELQWRGVYIWRHVLSTVVRRLLCGSAKVFDRSSTEHIQPLLAQAMRSVQAAELLIDQVKPQLVFFFEKGYSPFGEIFDVTVNRGIAAVHWDNSHRPDALVFKKYGKHNRHQHHFSLSPESWALIQKMPWNIAQEKEVLDELETGYTRGTWFSYRSSHAGKKIKTVDEVRKQIGLDPNKKTAVVFSHIIWDATFFFGKNLFADYEEWLVETIKIAYANTAVNWVIKLHPDLFSRWGLSGSDDGATLLEVMALKKELGPLPDHIRVLAPKTDISTFALMGLTDYCITVRGTIGIEMSCFGIPVFTAGTGRYSSLGFTIDSNNRAEYLDKLRRIHEYPRLTAEETTLARKHAYALMRLRPWTFNSFELVQMPVEQWWHPLHRNYEIKTRSLEELCKAEDLKSFARWAADSQEEDFLALPADQAHKTANVFSR
jgi:hypothetical protein